MAIQIIHVSDIHFGSGEGHGRINPQTGLNIRFEDFTKALSKVVDKAINDQCDVFLFSGDAYRNASPEPIYQKMFARELKRLSNAGIKTILLVGNHDQILKSNSSHSMSVFQSLEVPGIIIIDRPILTKIDTVHGAFQLIGLPHVTRHYLVASEKYINMTAASIDKALADNVQIMLKNYYDQLDPKLPTVVTAHMTVDRALAGIEQELLIGYTLTFPTDIFIDEKIDYVALGHVHKHQAIRHSKPAIVYAGSLERVDFGEQDEDKGFIQVNLERDNTTWQFLSIQPRPFVTIEADLTDSEKPTEYLCELIAKKNIVGCVLRVKYKLRHDQIDEINENKLQQAAGTALSFRLQKELVQPVNRARLPSLTETSVSSPLAALDTYLSEIAPERKERLLTCAKELINQLENPEQQQG